MGLNPYLKENRRSEVIAALTALGLYRYYKLSFDGWAERIANRPDDGHRWGQIFAEHPEFFRIDEDGKKASLFWRRQNPKNYDPHNSTTLIGAQFARLSSEERKALSRSPIAPEELTTLITVAVNLHDRALEQNKAKDWWKAIALSGLLAFVGALLGVWTGKH